MEFKIGQILNFHSTNLFAQLIRFGTKSHWNHSAIICDKKIENNTNYSLIYEALDDGFVCSWYEDWWLQNKFDNGTLAVGETKVKLNNIKINAEKYLGTDYGWLDIIRISLFILFKKRAFWWTDTKSLICSEAVAKILYDSSDKKINFVTEYGKPYSEITPQDLFVSKQIKWSTI